MAFLRGVTEFIAAAFALSITACANTATEPPLVSVRSGARFDKLAFPVGIVAEGDGRTVLVAESGSGELSRVDLESGGITRIATGLDSPRGVVLEGEGQTALVAESGAGDVSRVDLITGRVMTVATGLSAPSGLAYLPGKDEVLVTETASGQVSLLSLRTGQVVALAQSLDLPTGIVLGPSGTTALVALMGSRRVVEIDLGSGRSRSIVTGLEQPVALALEEGGRIMLVADAGIAALIRVSLETGSIIEKFGDGALDFPAGITLSGEGDAVFFTEADAGEISRLDLRSKQTEVVVEGLGKPVALLPEPGGAGVLVLETTGEISRLDLRDGSLETLASGLANPQGFALQEGRQSAVVSEAGSADGPGTDSGDVALVRLPGGEKEIIAAGLASPAGVTFVGSELVVLEKLAGRISFVDPDSGTVVPLPGALEEPIALLPGDDGESAIVLESSIGGGLIRVSLPSGSQQVLARGFLGARSISPGRNASEVFVADGLMGAILRVDLTAGSAVPLTEDLGSLSAIALEPDGRNLLAAGDFGLVRVDIETGQIDRLFERRTSPFP